MERLQPANATHFFLACRPERPRERYAIDFSSPTYLGYVPGLRTACLLSGDQIHLPGAKLTLTPAQLPFVQQVDGRRSIAEIIDGVGAPAGMTGRGSSVVDCSSRCGAWTSWRWGWPRAGSGPRV